jgi:hypothetical protein
VDQLIGVIATIYNFVRLPRAGVRSNDAQGALAVAMPAGKRTFSSIHAGSDERLGVMRTMTQHTAFWATFGHAARCPLSGKADMAS